MLRLWLVPHMAVAVPGLRLLGLRGGVDDARGHAGRQRQQAEAALRKRPARRTPLQLRAQGQRAVCRADWSVFSLVDMSNEVK